MSRTQLTRLNLLLILLVLPAGGVGCSPWVTYPPIEGAAQVGAARVEPVPTIMAEAVRYTRETHAIGDDVAFNLPQGTPPAVYADVRNRLRGAAQPMMEEGEPAIHVKEVRIRAREAQADVLYPHGDGQYRFATLFMRQQFLHHFRVTDSRMWRIHADVPPPHYPAAVAAREAEAEAADDADDANGASDDDAGEDNDHS